MLLGLIGYAAWLAARPGPPPDAAGATGAGPCEPAGADGVPIQPGTRVPLADPASTRRLLDSLTVAAGSGGESYCRGRFGPDTWPDLDQNGCSTRQDVLVRQAVTVRTARIRAHGSTCQEAMAGTWVDAYTGASLRLDNLKDPAQAQTLQIDHVVSLYDAWVSGAKDWSDERRVIFANDLANPELLAVSGETNFAKDRSGPESFTPATAYRCDYARAYVAVKAAYGLTITARQRAGLLDLLAACAG